MRTQLFKMLKINSILAIVGLFLVTTIPALAQNLKVGYINTQELIVLLPEVKIANDSIQKEKQRMEAKIETMVRELRAKASSLEKRKNEIAPIQYDKEVQLLQAEEKKIGEFEQLGQQELTVKTEGLLNPIQNKVNLAIKEVAATEGYNYIIDTAQGMVLYADPAANVLEKVKMVLLKK